MKKLTIFILSFLLFSCATSKVSMVGNKVNLKSHKNIVLNPGSGVLGQAVANELAGRGYRVSTPGKTTSTMLRLNLNEAEISKPKTLEALSKEGVEAVLIINTVGGYDQMPQSASVQLIETKSYEILAGVNWQNGWGGQAGSIADRVMRKGLTTSAAEIVNSLDAAYQSPTKKIVNLISK